MTFIPKEIQQRIANGIKMVENRLDDGTTPDVRHYGDQPDQWYKLTTGIDPSTHEASANPGKWDVSANSGAGAMTADTSVTRTLRDPTELLAGGKGNWVLCRPWGSQNGIVWQLAEGCEIIGKLDGSLSQGGSATLSIWSGVPGSEADSGYNVIVHDWVMKSGATAIASGKKCVAQLIGGSWYVTQAECP